jgi:hypothetical protein
MGNQLVLWVILIVVKLMLKNCYNGSIMSDNFRTVVPVKNPGWEIAHSTPLLLTGSCFAENIGALLKRARFDVMVNPHGIVFNPMSVARGIHDLIQDKCYTREDLTQSDGLWMSLFHHGKYNDTHAEVALNAINQDIETGTRQLQQAKVLMVTWGSAWAYRWRATGDIVANCHKIPQQNFEKLMLAHDEIVSTWKLLIHDLRNLNPGIKVLLTISPVRHWRDGVHENQISKAHLLIAAETLCQEMEEVFYFPSYEIVLDDLRDYRFYKEDMLHPNDAAVRYIWQRFAETYFSNNTNIILNQIEPLLRYLEHRPLHTSAELHARLCQVKEEEIQMLIG